MNDKNTPTLESRVAKALELGKRASAGPWHASTEDRNYGGSTQVHVHSDEGQHESTDSMGRFIAMCGSKTLEQNHANAVLIAAVPSHVDLIRDLAAEVVRLRADLEWASHNWGGQNADYAMHVLKRGGTGDVSDAQSYIDAARTGDSHER